MFIFLSLVEVTIEPSSEHMHFLQRPAKCTILIETLLNPDILQPLQSSTLLVVLVGMWAASPVGPLYRQLLSLRLVQRVIFALQKHKVKSLVRKLAYKISEP